MKKYVVFTLLTIWSALALAQNAPDELVRSTTQEVLTLIKKDKELLSGNQDKLLELVDAKVLPHFNFNRMTRLALGRNWATATPAQQAALEKEFRTLLVRTYSTALSAYREREIDVKPLRANPADTEVTVKTVVAVPNQPIPIDYAMEKTASGWKVYDVSVDGVSLVTNYRSSFANEIRTSGIEGLIKTLSSKNRALDSSEPKAAKKP